MENALKNLLRRIEAGEEYPDASWTVSCRENVSYEALQEAYDEYCARPQHLKDLG